MYGKKLKELRLLENWTQEQVAKKIGVSKQTYSHYENENRKPSLDTIRELAAVYQVDIDEIFATDRTEDPRMQFFTEMERDLGIDLSDPEIQKMLKRAAKLLFTDKD